MEASLRSDAWSLMKIAGYQNGKVLQWSWISRGLLSIENLADWYYGGDVEAAKAGLEATPGRMAELCRIDDIPNVDCSAEREQVEIAQSKQLEGQTFSFWTISDPTHVEAKPIPLPGWFKAPIDKAILLWQRESYRWEKVISDRLLQGKELAPKQHLAYNEWKSNETRSIVLDKKKQAQVVNLGSKTTSTLKKTCLMLVIHMSKDASGLHISTGSGKLWKLQLLQGVEPISDQVPAEVDHFEGYCFAMWV